MSMSMSISMMNLFLYIPLFLALYVTTTFIIHKLRSLPPTPFPCFPIIGHIYLLNKPLHRTLATLSEAYGPAFFLKLGFRSVLVVSSQTVAKDCLRHNDLFPENPQVLVSKFIGNKNAKLLSAFPRGTQWRTLRRILMSDLIYSGCLNLVLTSRRDEVKALIQRLYRQSSDEKGNDNGMVFEMKRVFYELTYRVIIRVIAGEEWCNGEKGDRFRKVLEEIVKVGKSTNIVANYVPFLSMFGHEGKLGKMFACVHGELDRILQELIVKERSRIISDEYEEDSRGSNDKTVIQVMLSLQLKDPVLYSDGIIKDLVLILLIVGTDACSTTMEWALSLLLNNPTVLHKAQAEIDIQIGHNRLIEETDCLPYLDSIIKETLRMYPAGPLLVPHESPKGCIVVEGGFRVPPGTLLLINMWAIHNNPKSWSEPREFKPERFEAGSENDNRGYKFLDLGSKNSQSNAEMMGISAVKVILGLVLQCFELETNGEKMVDMEEAALLTTTKAKPLQAKLRPRLAMMDFVSRF